MIQIVYISTSRISTHAERARILEASRRNNSADGITGLLYDDGVRFLQVLEGPDERVEKAMARIKADPRHRAVVTLSRRSVEAREFGDWAMASIVPGADATKVLARVDALLASASANVRATFQSFAGIRSAAA